MPKKFTGENSKATEAKARKDASKKAVAEKKEQAEEDEYWNDHDKNAMKRQQRKNEKEKKKQDQLEKKQLIKSLLEQETAPLAEKTKKPLKVHQAQIAATEEKKSAAASQKPSPSEEGPLEENLNRLNIDEASASNVDDALKILDGETSTADIHPEKRMKAAYLTFEEENMPRIKQENPTLRISQLKQILRKEWQKSPSNPFNR